MRILVLVIYDLLPREHRAERGFEIKTIATTLLHTLLNVLQERLASSSSPVERDIAAWLSHSPLDGDEGDAFRFKRYQRKIDVAHKLMTAYDDRIDKATSASAVSSECYLGLARVFIHAARHETGANETSRANILRWANSAVNCLDHVSPQDAVLVATDMDAELQGLFHKGSAS